jgi:hypothetical protein
MKIHFSLGRVKISLLASLAVLLAAPPSPAQITTNWWVYNGNQGGSPGTNWSGTGITAYWKLNNAGTAATPAPGTVTDTTTNYNFYSLTNNGIQLGNGTGTALIRNPYSANTPTVISFPGDTLILQTNAQLRFKNLGGVGTFVSGVNYATPTNLFLGNFGLPGLILNGGCLNNGQSGSGFVIGGSIYANPGSQSYLNPADSFNQDTVSRGLIFQAQLTGSGAIALLNGNSGAAVPVPTPFSGTSNNFTGTWIVMSGWLQGSGDGTGDGYNSLGTNQTVVFDIDPLWNPPSGGTSGGYGFSNNPAVSGGGNAFFYNGPAVLDFGSSLANLGGSLILTNGGQLYMHGNILLSNVTVEGTSLAPGTYSYSDLATAYPNNFVPSTSLYPNQSGTLTVQAYGKPVLPATIAIPPVSDVLYPDRTAVYTVVGDGSPPLTYQWYKNSVPLSDGGNLAGSQTSSLSVSGVSGTDSATYSVTVSNEFGTASAGATLLVVTPVQPYEAAVSNLNPIAYYQFDEVTNPALGDVPAYDYSGGFEGTYGTAVQNGFDNTLGPTPTTGFPGFAATNDAIHLATTIGNYVSAPAWNLNANTVTMVAWLNPDGIQNAAAGIVFCRGANTVAGLDYNGALNGDTGVYDLGYTWNNDPSTYDWDSGLVAPPGVWSMVSLVVTPTQATIYVMNTTGLTSATHVYPHVVQSFDNNNETLIGEDSFDGGNGTRSFLGEMDEVSVFNTALSGDQLASLFYVATEVTNYAPVIGAQPVAASLYTGQSFQLSIAAGGSSPVTYQWESGPTGGPYTPLSDGAAFSGTTTPTLTFLSATLSEAMDYICVVKNPASPAGIASSPATVTVQPAGTPLFNITMSQQEAAGADWDTVPNWSDNNPASVSALSEPGSIYEVLPGARLRSPVTLTDEVFPGQTLLLDGTGVWINNPAAGTTQGEFRLKQTNPLTGAGSVTFPLLVMNGGQMDLGNGGICIVDGVINVLSNGIFYSDGADDRGYLINAQLTGSNSIQYYGDSAAYPAGYSNNLAIAGTNNTFSGPWSIQAGMLLGLGSNSLGTNNIAIAAAGVFQTLYDLNDSNATLTLSGQLQLTQTDTFHSVFLGSVPLPAGTYTAAELSSNYPAYFPSNWVAKAYAPTPTNAQGEIIVLATPGPSVLQQPVSLSLYAAQTALFTVSAGGNPPLGYQWESNGIPITDGGNVSGTLTTSLTLSDIIPADAASYTVVITNSLGGTTSQVATLTVLPTLPAENITMSAQEAVGQDWETVGFWTDSLGGVAASVSSLEEPGSTYEVLPGAILRTPAEAIAYTNFPGDQLTIDGTGVWIDLPGAGSAQGELRFKQGQSGGIVYFPLLIMAGGQWDNGNASTLDVIQGNIDIVSNTPIYADDSGSTGIRPYQVDAYLFGNGSIEYHDSDASLGGGLNITCPTNAFTGTWNIVTGAVLGSGNNSLGTNSIDVSTNGVLETTYDINSPNATLSLSNAAVMYLHQNDTFLSVNINGTQLAAGKWTFSQLAAAYPATFPASWNAIMTSSFTSGSGSINVLSGPSQVVPIPLQFQFGNNSLTLTWSQGSLLDATNLAGPWETNTTATSPYVIAPTNAQEYFKIVVGQ